MADLVDAERVRVEFRRGSEISPEGVLVGVVVVAAEDVAVELVEAEDEPADLRAGMT